MPKTKKPAAEQGSAKGSFVESRSGLLSLFDEPDGGGERSWRESFGYERRPKKTKGGKPFIAREARKSSSGW